MRNRKPKATPDPAIPEISLDIDGKQYRLSFDFAALATAKAKLRERGVQMNILRSLDFQQMDVDTVPALFFAAAQKFQPEMTCDDAFNIVNLRTVAPIFEGLAAAYQVAQARPKLDPPKADRSS